MEGHDCMLGSDQRWRILLMSLLPRWRILVVAAALALGQTQCLLIPQDKEHGERVPNHRPHVKITGGVYGSDSSGVGYLVDFKWHGWDDDGVVIAFEWAVDDTTLEGAWRRTSTFSDVVAVRATTWDPGDGMFHDWHRFFIRSVDNEFSRSAIDARFFNARTIAPETRITFPLIYGGHLRRPRTFFVRWEGEDLDSSLQERTPAQYEYKLVEVEFGDDPIPALLEGTNVFLDTLDVGDKKAWVRVSGEVTTLRLTELPVPNLYVFGVRAIDEAGALEPSLDEGENYFVFEVTEQGCEPIVTIAEGRLGEFTFPLEGPIWTVEVPAEVPIRFRWIGDTSDCGSIPGNVNYGFDLPDPGDDDARAQDGIGGWIGWGLWERMQSTISFPARDHEKIHNFYLKMRDDSNDRRSETFCWVQCRVVAFPMNNAFLVVDDASPPRALGGTDGEHDAYRDRVLTCAWEFLDEGEHVEFFDIYGVGDRSINPAKMRLSLVAQYKVIIWNSVFHGHARSGLARNEYDQKLLTNYVGAGGRLFLYGSQPVCGFADDWYATRTGDGLCPDASGVDNVGWDESSFIWKFLHIRNCIRSSTSGIRGSQVDGWVGAQAVHPLYPDLHINTAIWDPSEANNHGEIRGGVNQFQVYLASRQIVSRPDPGMDTIYVAETYNYGGGSSRLFGKPIALRYESTPEDTALGIHHGRVFLQMFPYYFVPEGPAREAACKTITWMMTGRDE
jgi:hypothetical protein